MNTITWNKEEGVFGVFLSLKTDTRHFGTMVMIALMPWFKKLSLLAVIRGKFTLYSSFGEWRSGRLIEVGRLKVAVLWNFFIKDSLGVGQGNGSLAILEGVYMSSFRPKRGGNEGFGLIQIWYFIYMRPAISVEPTSSVLVPEALPFVSAASAV